MNTIPPNRRILLIDDNESIHQDFRKILNPAASGKAALASAAAELFGQDAAGASETIFEIDSAFQGRDGLEKVRQACAEDRPYAMAFVDLRMPPGWDGIETISRIWSEYPGLEVVICTAYSDYSLAKISARLGRTDRLLILKKPFDAIEVLQFADALTEKWRLGREAHAKMEELEERVAERTLELREGQKQLNEARKMELVGKLAGGIAHDFNTLLTSIIGHAELIRQVAPEAGLPYQSAGEISKSAASAATLTHQLLAFSRRQMLKLELIDVNAAITDISPMLRELLGDAIEVATIANARNPWATADAGQFREVLISLAHNARDAMPHGGKLTLETGDVKLDAADASGDSELSPGDYVTISVTDTGGGIPDEVKPHLFEPYFTTKGPGGGKGLGLAMCHGFIKQSGGHIRVTSGLGRGTTIAVYLPRLREASAAGLVSPPSGGEACRKASCTEVILLVEEDATLRGLAADSLEKQGYTIYRAGGSREAISIAGGLKQVDLLITGNALPEMTGSDLAQWICATHPQVKVLFVYPSDEDERDDGDEAVSLRKPFTPAILSASVRMALDAAGAEVMTVNGS